MAVIKDVAKLAGVSTATVSKYLNNSKNLKEETRLKVEKAIAMLQYKPNPLARSMRTGKTNTIAIMAPDILNPFFAEVYNSIRMAATRNGYTSILYTTEDDLDVLKDYLSGMSIRQVDGVILCFLDEDESVEKFIEALQGQIPIVLLSWNVGVIRFDSVVVDVFEGIYKSTKHIIEKGYRDIAYVGGPKNSRISREKYAGYEKAMKEAELEVIPEFVFHGDNYSIKTGYEAARNFSMQRKGPRAIVCANDILALGSMKYLLNNRIRIPDDIAVIGFDNIVLSSMYEPALSTVSLPIVQMGEEAMNLLLNRIKKLRSKRKQVVFKTELVIRNSTDKKAPLEFKP